jgi:hypothetical protein
MNYYGDIVASNANLGFMFDENFVSAYKNCVEADRGRLLLNGYDIRWRIHTLLFAAKLATNLDGDFVDCGCGFGLFASAILSYINLQNTNKKYYMFDTFEGLSEKYSTSDEMIRNTLIYKTIPSYYDEVVERFKNKEYVRIVKGAVPESLAEVNIDKVAFLSIDMNCVIPEEKALEHFWPRLVSGGVIVFDDYGFPKHEEQKKAHDSFAAKHNLVIYTSPTGQGILIKP